MIDNATLQGLAVILGLPLITIALGEFIERLDRNLNPLAEVLSAVRNLLLPPLVLWLVLRQFFQVPEKASAMRGIASCYWLALTYVLLLLFNTTLSTGRKHKLIDIPNLLFQFLRAFIVLIIMAYILGRVWNIDLTKIIGALGIGSVVIAISLQDTLSNLVSGFLLIVESPFKVGDWIKVGQLEGEVLEINWRAVRIKTLDRDVVIIPNGNLGKENICNYTLLDKLHAVRLRIPFSYEDRPDTIDLTLRQVALTVDGIEPKPVPETVPKIFNSTYIEYEMVYFITHYNDLERIEAEFWHRAYYAVRRAGFKIPFANKLEYKLDFLPPDTDNNPEKILPILRSFSLFNPLDSATIEHLSQHGKIELFGIGEKIVCAGELDRAFYILLGGQALLLKENIEGKKQEITYLTEGDFLGETVFLSKKPSLVSAIVTNTVTAISIKPSAITRSIQQSAQFALEISQFIDERKKLIGIAAGIETKVSSTKETWPAS
ncbi:MAG: mechanosensitive ion channel family protein [Cyanobacteria bacterium P01_A01_bin.40]